MQLLFRIAVVIMFLVHTPVSAFTQVYQKTEIVPYLGVHEGSRDSVLRVYSITPMQIDSIIKSSSRILLCFYKPYCSGLTYYDNYRGLSQTMKYCMEQGIPILFIAVSTHNLNNLHYYFSNRYHVPEIPCYVISDSYRNRHLKKIIKTYGEPKKKSVIYIESQQIKFQTWISELPLERFKELAKL
jgi:hypothetical protein